HAAGAIFVAQERGEGIEDGEVDGVSLPERQDAVEEGTPISRRGDAAEGTADETGVAAEVVTAGTVGPERGRLFGDDDGFARLDGESGQRAVALPALTLPIKGGGDQAAAGEEEGDEGRF